MSVTMMLRVKGVAAAFETYAQENAEQMERISAEGKAAGARHHYFAADGEDLLAIDEWPDEQSFQGFFSSQTEIPEVMAAVGAQGEPDVSFFRNLDTSDSF